MAPVARDGLAETATFIEMVQENGSRRRHETLLEVVRLTRVAGSLLSGRMTRRRNVVDHLGGALVLALALLSACTGNAVGRICDLGTAETDPSEVVIAAPSLDCVSRTCLRVPDTNPSPPPGSMYPTGASGLCTAECSADSDCDRVPESPCVGGFTCGVAVTVGPFCCEKFCICKDYIVVPETGELATPMACDPTNAGNACCNLSGRANNSTYPLCGT